MATNPDQVRPSRAGRTTTLLLAALVAAVASSLPAPAAAANYTVGDEKGWNPKVDYTAWVKKHKPFYKGDWLRNYPNPSSSSSSASSFSLRIRH